MANNTIDLATMSVEELREEASGLSRELQQMKFDHAVKGLGNPMELRYKRKEIARILTELRARELAAMTAEQLAARTKIRARRRK